MTSVTSIKLEETRNSIANDVFETLDQLGLKKYDVNEHSESQKVAEANLTNIWKRSPSYTNSYDEEWCRLFNPEDLSLQNLRSMGLLGELRNCRFRSVCWRLYLGILSENSDHWQQEVLRERNIYINLRNEYIIDPRQNSTFKDDPLSLRNESQWNKYFRSQDVMKEIQQDVVRTFPEIEFFHSNVVRTSMINVLYCYSQSSRLSYRQGMHEILAPLIFVLHCDHMAYEHSCELSRLSDSTRTIGGVLLDSSYLEHDAHSMFARLMQIIEPWYDSTPSDSRRPLSISLTDPRPFSRQAEPIPDCSIGERLASIHDKVLRRQDLDLYLHLEHLEISPQMFGLRWLKLLFGREYTMQDLLMVWDVVFAVGNQFSLVDHIYVSMLVNIRDFLLANDFATCLTQLMRYPSNVDVNRIIDLALHLFDPEKYEKPIDVTQYHHYYYGGVPSMTLDRANRRSKRAQRNKTIVGIETIANKFTNFINNKKALPPSPLPDQTRPSVLKYRQAISSVSDSAPVTPTNKPIEREVSMTTNTDVSGEYMDINTVPTTTSEHIHDPEVVNMCVSLLDQSLIAIQLHNIDQAVTGIKQARDILTGNLTVINRKTLINELQITRPSHLKTGRTGPAVGLNRSVSNNDISLLINHGPTTHNGFDLSQEILRLVPTYNDKAKNVELQDFRSRKSYQVTIDGSAHFSIK